MRSRWLIPLVMAAACLCATPGTAWAEDPVTFGASHIADPVGAVTERSDEVTAALDTLYADTGTDLFVVYVDSFTGVSDRTQWADKTADNNGLGTKDVLLAVATGDREYQLSVAPDFTLTDAQLAEVETVAIEPALRQNDWAGAAIGAAEGLAASLKGQPVAAPAITPGSAPGGSGSTPAGSGSGFLVLAFVAITVIVLLIAGLVLFFALRGRRRTALPAPGSPATGLEALPTPELKRRAASTLVQTDDAIRSSEQELGFAIAQYGTAATAAFQSTLGTAKAQLTQAFGLQQQLDDAIADSEEQQRAWYAGIVDLCGQANAALDAQADSFDELRQLEKNAPEMAASVAREAAAVTERVASAEASLAALATRYSEAVLGTVADNAGEARDRLAFTSTALTEAGTRLAAGDTAAAAVGIRAAEESVDQATLLLDAVDRLGADLRAATQGVAGTLAELQADIITARSLPTDTAASAALPVVIEQAERTLAEVNARLDADQVNPLELMRMLDAANTPMDAALQGVRDAVAQAQRVQSALNQNLLAARGRVSAAEDFITARRGAVGAEARTRLAEASRLLLEAESTAATDPGAALSASQRANALAADAIARARSDVDGFAGQG